MWKTIEPNCHGSLCFLRFFVADHLSISRAVRNVLLENPDGPINFTVVSSDMELNAAGALEGIQIEDPNNY